MTLFSMHFPFVYGHRNYPYESVHIDAARNLARYAKEAGVPRFIHMSALNASTRSELKFLSSKVRLLACLLDHF